MKNVRRNSELWSKDISLVERNNENDVEEVFEGYAA